MWYPSLSNSRALLLEDCNKDVDNDGDYNILLYDFRVREQGGVMTDWLLFSSGSMFTFPQGDRTPVCSACDLISPQDPQEALLLEGSF